MKFLYRKKFLKDLARIPSKMRFKIEHAVFDELVQHGSILTGKKFIDISHDILSHGGQVPKWFSQGFCVGITSHPKRVRSIITNDEPYTTLLLSARLPEYPSQG